MPMQAALVKNPVVSVNHCIWSPEEAVLGIAFSKHIVHIYFYTGIGDLRQHLEIDAHAGDEFQIKFWDMDNTNILTTIDVEGISILQASPRLHFSKDGSLLTVTTNDNGICYKPGDGASSIQLE